METSLDAEKPSTLHSLNPGVFAIVMGTGICSIAAWQQKYFDLADAMLWLDGIIYVILWILVAVQLFVSARQFAQNFVDHVRLPGVLTVVAGTGVLGSEVILIAGWNALATALWLLAVALWIVLIYAFFFIMITRKDKPALERGIDGLWLLAVVSTQSIAVLGALIATTLSEGRTGVLFLSLAFWLAGSMIYVLIITLIFYRLAFFGVTPETLTAPYWINMGALAITTLAGTDLALRAPQWVELASLLPFIKGFTLFFWAAGTWWIPLLAVLGIWRHASRGRLPGYDLQYWGIIFPLGMYTACTYNLAKVLNLEFLGNIPKVSVFVALVAWALLFGALLHVLAMDALRWTKQRRRGTGFAGPALRQ